MDNYLYDFSQRLQRITCSCRDDMHEPEEQGVSAILSGFQLNNAMGDNPVENCGEMTVGITKEICIVGITKEICISDFGVDTEIEWFNLATLIALAKIGARYLQQTRQEGEMK